MKTEKFENDVRVVHKFIQLYCDNNHADHDKKDGQLILFYHDTDLGVVDYHLCETCEKTLKYSHQRLIECPHDEKPRCRKCPNPCYEKSEWKALAKIMRYSGMQLGLLKIRKIFGKSS
ncbi:nitrous oxide-stimulated promoter family protein [Sulfurospirillum sp. 1612]|uniref:nitrous oxide-stimulated promoter family protein n=1 Tax=Sulfurospirillum sp. 1612 TaxID=3094835 RepID=UPI002F91D08C